MLLSVDRVFSSANMRELGFDTFLLLHGLLIKKIKNQVDGGGEERRWIEPVSPLRALECRQTYLRLPRAAGWRTLIWQCAAHFPKIFLDSRSLNLVDVSRIT